MSKLKKKKKHKPVIRTLGFNYIGATMYKS